MGHAVAFFGCLQSVALQRKSYVSEHVQFMFTSTLLGTPLLSMQQESLMGIWPHFLLPVRVWPSLVPRPRPAFHHLQHGKALPYCNRQKAGRGLGTRLSLAHKTKVGHGWTLLIKMAEATLTTHFSYLNRLALSTFTEVGPQFSNQDSRLGSVIEKAKKLSILQYPRSITV